MFNFIIGFMKIAFNAKKKGGSQFAIPGSENRCSSFQSPILVPKLSHNYVISQNSLQVVISLHKSFNSASNGIEAQREKPEYNIDSCTLNSKGGISSHVLLCHVASYSQDINTSKRS